ncbi:hypothetical protein Psuf_073850 [Phytohabitans suffuscus]|uniref:HTH cro/C1-type domain-containing protein n=1 Tax=Phytohabitans suffuscus TaxID=624315 RepID=A0A6F8YVC3_9ACTN|nr:hypothetical protein Psuf_073850 [Phytohabitans suffuscus]
MPAEIVTATQHFGTQLRRRREIAGLSLKALASRVHFDPGHISRIENGRRKPSVDFALRCDAVLGAGGELAALAAGPRSRAAQPPPAATAEMVLRLRPDGQVTLAVGEGVPLPALGMPDLDAAPHEPGLAGVFEQTFALLRRLGQRLPPATVLASVAGQVHALHAVARTGAQRDRYLRLAARHAEYAGWLGQEAGDHRAALWWTDQAERLAAQAGDTDLAAYVWVRRAEMAVYRHDSAQALSAAEQALRRPAAPHVHGLANHRQAQGHALVGASTGCIDALDRAAELLDAGDRGGGTLGSSTIPDLQEATAGWCYLDLGRLDSSAALLERTVAGIPEVSRRARGLFSARLALAHALGGDYDRASEAGHEAMVAVRHTRSATTLSQLHELGRELRRHRQPAARQLHRDLVEVLHGTTPPPAATAAG